MLALDLQKAYTSRNTEIVQIMCRIEEYPATFVFVHGTGTLAWSLCLLCHRGSGGAGITLLRTSAVLIDELRAHARLSGSCNDEKREEEKGEWSLQQRNSTKENAYFLEKFGADSTALNHN